MVPDHVLGAEQPLGGSLVSQGPEGVDLHYVDEIHWLLTGIFILFALLLLVLVVFMSLLGE